MTCDTPATWCDSWYNMDETRRVQEQMYRLQHPANCSAAAFYRYYQVPGVPMHGIGSYIHVLSAAFAAAMSENRTFLNEAQWVFSDPNSCPQQNPDCLFWPLTPCKPSDAENNYTATGWMRPIRELIPEQWQHKGLFWWRAQAVKYFLRPRAPLLAFLDRVRKETFPPDGVMPRPIISLHIRHGDKWKEAELLPAKRYMQAIETAQLKQLV